MAFNFNWTPLSTTSSEFYSRAKDLLTAALNKAPKPPIIVDDIIVDELNLGSTAPELEILEIGDLAEDRFRGIFKMSYGGDAELTLRTKVQANPLSTYLSTTPSFTSPCPLAASAPLTIPLQITLSQFRLSGFIILVFSKAKGITIVFRNDPLESLRVSSTFDSIPFIKEYLQKEIERVVRGLFQEELPVGIHRLSLRWFNPEYAASLDAENTHHEQTASGTHSPPGESDDENATSSPPYINPLAPSPEEPNQAQFSQQNMLRLETLLSSQKTLSVFTPTMKDVVYRAWATSSAAPYWSGGLGGTETPGTPGGGSSSTTYTFSDSGDAVTVTSSGSGERRPGLTSSLSSMSVAGLGLGSGGSVTGGRLGRGRKKKHRVVNLRRKTDGDVTPSATEDSSAAPSTPATPSSATFNESSPALLEDDLEPEYQQNRFLSPIELSANMKRSGSTATRYNQQQHLSAPAMAREISIDSTRPTQQSRISSPSATANGPYTPPVNPPIASTQVPAVRVSEDKSHSDCHCHHTHTHNNSIPVSPNPWLNLAAMVGAAGSGGGSSILEQAVLMKLASEVARLQQREKERECERERELAVRRGDVGDVVEVPPPAYGA